MKLLEYIKSLHLNSNYDICLKINPFNIRFNLHKIILQQCHFFENYFDPKWKPHSKSDRDYNINIDEIGFPAAWAGEILAMFFRWLYIEKGCFNLYEIQKYQWPYLYELCMYFGFERGASEMEETIIYSLDSELFYCLSEFNHMCPPRKLFYWWIKNQICYFPEKIERYIMTICNKMTDTEFLGLLSSPEIPLIVALEVSRKVFYFTHGAFFGNYKNETEIDEAILRSRKTDWPVVFFGKIHESDIIYSRCNPDSTRSVICLNIPKKTLYITVNLRITCKGNIGYSLISLNNGMFGEAVPFRSIDQGGLTFTLTFTAKNRQYKNVKIVTGSKLDKSQMKLIMNETFEELIPLTDVNTNTKYVGIRLDITRHDDKTLK